MVIREIPLPIIYGDHHKIGTVRTSKRPGSEIRDQRLPLKPDANSSATYLFADIPDPFGRTVALVASVLIATFCAVRLALPSRRIVSLDKDLDEMTTLYNKAVDNHLLNFQLGSDLAIANEVLERLRIQSTSLTLPASPSAFWLWTEFLAIFNGHCCAIVKCTWRIVSLERKIELLYESRAHDLNVAVSGVGLCPSQQAWLRRKRTLTSEN
ncbi:hypothetical protein C8R47DRAFT_1068792 [Mycena vitilis]|nr:hypothetical protein C8R47DRAFT_1068792 [Mycena vitilis]